MAYTPAIKEYKSALYDGSAEGYNDWLANMQGALGPVRLYTCLMKADYHGIDKDGKRVTSVDPSDIECGLDAQSFTAMWMQNTLTGSAKGTYNTLQSEITKNNSLCDCDSAPGGYQRRLSPTAYSVHMAIKELAKPDDCIKKLTRDMNEFHSPAKNLPANATATQAHKWLNEMA